MASSMVDLVKAKNSENPIIVYSKTTVRRPCCQPSAWYDCSIPGYELSCAASPPTATASVLHYFAPLPLPSAHSAWR